MQSSQWNDELKIWKLPETAMNAFKLPLASSLSSKKYIGNILKRVNSSNALHITNNSSSTSKFIPADFAKDNLTMTSQPDDHISKFEVESNTQNNFFSNKGVNENEPKDLNFNDIKAKNSNYLQVCILVILHEIFVVVNLYIF